ncbi:hypothetical protein VDG1235_3152 [Verrucomicrobiia bacterium DG1235]|nr:hypothetical protein VDG1235_3152 [Verrucomicrobiae bacterium DG1235]
MKIRLRYNSVLAAAAMLASSALVFGQEASVALKLADELERGIYLHEGEGDLDSAALAYEGILAETELLESLAAETCFRLASVYLEQGKKALAFKLLGDLVENYPDEAPWVAEATAILPKDFVPEITPWTDGERTHFKWVLPTGNTLGFSFSTISRYEWEGREFWRKETRFMLNGNRATAVEFDPETFRSAYSEMNLDTMGTVRAWYGEDGLSAKVEFANSDSERSYNFQEQVYDNEQAHELMRQLPLEVGYAMEKKIFVTFSGVPVDINFEVGEIEKMDTALGMVDCYSVKISFAGQKQTAYFTADDRRLPIKLVNGGLEAILTKVETVDYDSKMEYRNEELGFSVEIPSAWAAVPHDRGNSEERQRIWFAEPMVRGLYAVDARTNIKLNAEEPLSVALFVEKAKERLLEKRKGGALDEDWTKAIRVGNLEGVACRMAMDDSKPNGDDVYMYALLGDEKHYIFEAMIAKGDEADMVPVLEGIVESLKETP